MASRLLSVEAAEAPGTPTAEAKRPQTSPRAEATSDVAGAAAVLAASASEDPARPPAASPPRQPQAAAAAPPEPLDLPQAEAQNGPVAPEPLQEPAAASNSGKGAEEVEENGAATDTRALPNGVADHAAALQLQSDLERQAHLAQVRSSAQNMYQHCGNLSCFDRQSIRLAPHRRVVLGYLDREA